LHPEEDRDIFAYRVNGDDGTADNSFGINGWSSLRVPVSNESINSAVLQPDGKYCFGGRTDYHGNGDFLIGRVNAAGLLDVSFGNSGLSTTEIYPEKDNSIAAVALSPDCDMLYAAGNTNTPKEYSMAIAAYHTGFGQGTGLGGESNFTEWVIVSPNPVEDQCRLHTGHAGSHQVRIFDAAGNIVFYRSHRGENTEFNLGFLAPGVYILQVILPEKQVGTYKLIKQ
jgi:hypothetical protein